MRFKKGDRVEVMNKIEGPVSWRTAEILSGNAHTYHVKYDSFPGMTSKQMSGKISRKFIRPCPPLMQGVECFAAGDIVEVFYDYSWKIAAISKVLGGKKRNKSSMIFQQASAVQIQYLVRLLGYSEELNVARSNIRFRQAWHDDKWILIGKRSGGGDEVLASKPSTSNFIQQMDVQISQFSGRATKQPQRDYMDIQGATFSKSPMISSRSLKRMSPYSSVVEAYNAHIQNFRGIEKDGMKRRMIAAPLLEKGLKSEACIITSKGLKMMPEFVAFSWHKLWTILLSENRGSIVTPCALACLATPYVSDEINIVGKLWGTRK